MAIDSGSVKVIYCMLARGGFNDPHSQDPELPESSLNATAVVSLTTLTNNYLHGLDFFHLCQYYISSELYRNEAHVSRRPVRLV